MTNKLREAAQQALRQMERSESNLHKARAALREALAEQSANIGCLGMPVNTPVTAPQPAKQPLTDEEIYECERLAAIRYQHHKHSIRGQQLESADDFQWHFARAIERAHGIGEAK